MGKGSAERDKLNDPQVRFRPSKRNHNDSWQFPDLLVEILGEQPKKGEPVSIKVYEEPNVYCVTIVRWNPWKRFSIRICKRGGPMAIECPSGMQIGLTGFSL